MVEVGYFVLRITMSGLSLLNLSSYQHMELVIRMTEELDYLASTKILLKEIQ